MTRGDQPAPPDQPEAALVLPRPNLGPEPWSEPPPRWGSIELVLVSTLAIAALILAARKRRAQRDRREAEVKRATNARIDPGAEVTPSHRLIASSRAVRAALIATFGPTWGSRTTEEIARDPALGDRMGEDFAREVVAYLERVDRAKFAGEEIADVDASIATAQAVADQLSRPASPGKRGS